MSRSVARAAVVVLAGLTTLTVVATLVPATAQTQPPAPPNTPDQADPASDDEQIANLRSTSAADWRAGEGDGVLVLPGTRTGVVMSRPAGTTDYADPHTGETTTWEYSTWTSPVTELPFDATELVASWNAATPAGTWISVELQGTYTNGETTPWYVMGRWASGDDDIKRTSVDGQGDPYSSVWTDTFSIDDAEAGVLLSGYQYRLTLYRTPGTHRTPRVWMLGAMASNVPDRFEVAPSEGGIAWGTELDVPRRSQNIHSGNYPEYGGGGEVWCSPTSTTMVMEYYGFRPSRRDLAWIEPGYTDPQVAHAARMTWDYTYEGAGNWPFNAAYAASFLGLDGFVTRLHSLDDIERLVAAGIPVITSQSFLESELDGAGYGTAGHLFVVVGFTEDGDVIVNDPASSSNASVRHVYPREQFEEIWLRTKRYNASGNVAGGSGGVAYIIKPYWVSLPEGGNGAW